MKKTIQQHPLDFEAFMTVIRFFGVNFIYQGGYTNDDYQLYIIDQGETIKIEDYYDAYDELPDGEGLMDINESKARILTIPMPKTIQEAVELLPVIFKDSDWTQEEKEEIINDYDIEVNGSFIRTFFQIGPNDKLKKT